MDEVFPVVAGVALGLATQYVQSRRLRTILVVVLGLALGATASWISGEFSISRIYLVIGAAQVLAAAVMTLVLVIAWSRRPPRWMSR